jgi:hypothetical protein
MATPYTSTVSNPYDGGVPPPMDGPPLQKPKRFRRTPYILIGLGFAVLLIAWVIAYYLMFYQGSGVFTNDYQRPVPADPSLVPVNGQIVTLTPEESEALDKKIQDAITNTN